MRQISPDDLQDMTEEVGKLRKLLMLMTFSSSANACAYAFAESLINTWLLGGETKEELHAFIDDCWGVIERDRK